MTVAKSPGATRKRGPISTGSKIVRFDISGLNRRFTVLEDVICRSSRVFKARFQQQRKEITTNCSTCFDDLDAVTEEITFCDKCGQNFHEVCIAKWRLERLRTFQPMTCPMCRGRWTDRSRPDIEHLKIKQELDGQAVQVYLDWLYSGTVRIDDSIPRTNDDFNVVLLQCWEVSDAMGDETFREAVIQEFFGEAEAHFWAKSIDYAFVDGKGSEATRDFVMDVFLTGVPNDWFKTESEKWPKTFAQKLADHCLKKALSGEKIKTYEEIETMYMKSQADEDKEEVMDVVSADDEDVEDLPLHRLRSRMKNRRPSFLLTRKEAPAPPRKQRKLTKNQAAITAAMYIALLPCLDLIDPLMELNAPARLSRSTLQSQGSLMSESRRFNEYDEAEVIDSEEETEEEEQVKLMKPRKKDKLDGILSQPGTDLVELCKGPFKSSETIPASEDEEQATKVAENEGKKKSKAKGAKKTKKRQTEVERLGGPVEDKPMSRRSSRVKAHETEGLDKAEDSADEAGLENQDAADEDANCWCTASESLRRPAIWKGGRWM
ncbi:hypothetical protein E8E11_008249 [Didymella keratinophila]|nr:hypothetical protein E8E11_008249 [Didymella keratinophila]